MGLPAAPVDKKGRLNNCYCGDLGDYVVLTRRRGNLVARSVCEYGKDEYSPLVRFTLARYLELLKTTGVSEKDQPRRDLDD